MSDETTTISLEVMTAFITIRNFHMSFGKTSDDALAYAVTEVKNKFGVDLTSLVAVRNDLVEARKLLASEKKISKSSKSPKSKEDLPNLEDFYNSTDLGSKIRLSAAAFNELLGRKGFMTRTGMVKHPTEKASGLYYVKPNADTTRPYAVYWKIEILELLE